MAISYRLESSRRFVSTWQINKSKTKNDSNDAHKNAVLFFTFCLEQTCATCGRGVMLWPISYGCGRGAITRDVSYMRAVA